MPGERAGGRSVTTAVAMTDAAEPLRSADRVVLALLLGGVRLLQALPETFVLRTAALIGRVCYAVMPARRRLVRDNLKRVCVELARRGTGSERARAAAADDRALDSLTRRAFEHWVRTYAESAIAPASGRGGLVDRVELANPEVTQRALHPAPGGRGVMYVGFHFGSVELAAAYAARNASLDVAGPMERLPNPALRAYFERTREQLGVRLLPIEDVAAQLTARLAAGQGVALVADRVIGGAGAAVTLFGGPARLPRGPAILAVESGAETFIVTMTRIGWNRWSARLDQLRIPETGSRREKVAAAIADEVRILEDTVGRAPEQWWSLFFPIWTDTPEAKVAPK
jgi:lauroyl/myristoyl acyltransferase